MGAFPRRHGVRHGLEAALFPGLHHPEAGLLRQHLVRGLRGSHRHRRPAATHDHGHLLQGTLCKKRHQQFVRARFRPGDRRCRLAARQVRPAGFRKGRQRHGLRTPRGLLGHRPCLQLLPQEYRPGEGRQEHDQVERPVRLHRPYRGRGRAADIRHHQLARGAPDDGGAPQELLLQPRERAGVQGVLGRRLRAHG